MGKKASGHKKAYYTNQAAVTARHKSARAAKRKKRLEFWIAKGTKKNGKPVLSLADRKVRAQARKAARDEKRKQFGNRRRELAEAWQARNPGKTFDKRKFKPAKDEE